MRYDPAFYVRQDLVDEGASSMGKGGDIECREIGKEA